MISLNTPRATRHTIEAGGTFESNGISVDYTSRITFCHHPAEPCTRLDPGCDEAFDVDRVQISLREGVWIELTPGEYSDDDVIDTIIDWREKQRSNADLYGLAA